MYDGVGRDSLLLRREYTRFVMACPAERRGELRRPEPPSREEQRRSKGAKDKEQRQVRRQQRSKACQFQHGSRAPIQLPGPRLADRTERMAFWYMVHWPDSNARSRQWPAHAARRPADREVSRKRAGSGMEYSTFGGSSRPSEAARPARLEVSLKAIAVSLSTYGAAHPTKLMTRRRFR
jgi:hypothetical protein